MRMVFPGDPGYLNPAYPRQELRRASAGDGLARQPETGTKKIVALAQNAERGNSSFLGPLLFDRFPKPIYISEMALPILYYPGRPRNGQLRSFLLRRIDSLQPEQDESLCPNSPKESSSGKRLYEVRAFTLKPRLGKGPRPTLAVILERNQRASIHIARAAKKNSL